MGSQRQGEKAFRLVKLPVDFPKHLGALLAQVTRKRSQTAAQQNLRLMKSYLRTILSKNVVVTVF